MLASKWINAGLMVAVATPLAAALAAGTPDGPIGEDSGTAVLRAPVETHPAQTETLPAPDDGLSQTMAGGLTVATGVTYRESGDPAFYSAEPVPWSAEWFHVCEASYTTFDPVSGTYIGEDGERHFC